MAHLDGDASLRVLVLVVPDEAEPVGEDGDGPDALEGEAAGGVEVVGRVAPEARRLVDGDGGGHELGRVQADHRRPGGQGPLEAGLEQRPPDAQPTGPGLDPERPQPGPAGRPPEPLVGGVGVVGDRAHDPPAVLGDQHLTGPGAGLDVEDVGQVPPEHRRGQRRRVFLVGGQQHPPGGRQVGRPGGPDPGVGETGR